MFATITINDIDYRILASNMGDFEILMMIDGECVGSATITTLEELLMFLAYGTPTPIRPSDFQNGGLDSETADEAYEAISAVLETAHRIDIFGIIYGGLRRVLPKGWRNPGAKGRQPRKPRLTLNQLLDACM